MFLYNERFYLEIFLEHRLIDNIEKHSDNINQKKSIFIEFF